VDSGWSACGWQRSKSRHSFFGTVWPERDSPLGVLFGLGFNTATKVGLLRVSGDAERVQNQFVGW
jgi:hypothetical protein